MSHRFRAKNGGKQGEPSLLGLRSLQSWKRQAKDLDLEQGEPRFGLRERGNLQSALSPKALPSFSLPFPTPLLLFFLFHVAVLMIKFRVLKILAKHRITELCLHPFIFWGKVSWYSLGAQVSLKLMILCPWVLGLMCISVDCDSSLVSQCYIFKIQTVLISGPALSPTSHSLNQDGWWMLQRVFYQESSGLQFPLLSISLLRNQPPEREALLTW